MKMKTISVVSKGLFKYCLKSTNFPLNCIVFTHKRRLRKIYLHVEYRDLHVLVYNLFTVLNVTNVSHTRLYTLDIIY